MVFYYTRKAGLVADIALFLNIFFLIGVLASLGLALTLPGIAGIVLNIGMSVDANVLINERIREELAAGKGIKMAIQDGYKNALSAIIDGNLTTLITGIILYIQGAGPVKGFAQRWDRFLRPCLPLYLSAAWFLNSGSKKIRTRSPSAHGYQPEHSRTSTSIT
jgi:protein-export membrane protein SecD